MLRALSFLVIGISLIGLLSIVVYFGGSPNEFAPQSVSGVINPGSPLELNYYNTPAWMYNPSIGSTVYSPISGTVESIENSGRLIVLSSEDGLWQVHILSVDPELQGGIEKGTPIVKGAPLLKVSSRIRLPMYPGLNLSIILKVRDLNGPCRYGAIEDCPFVEPSRLLGVAS